MNREQLVGLEPPSARKPADARTTDDSAAELVSPEMIAARLRSLEAITATPGQGITRLAFSEEDRRARDCLVGWMREAGLVVRIDAAGNIIGRRAGSVDGPAVLTGSHLDSVPHGGNYDGVVGVLGAIEAARALAAAGVPTQLPLEFICFASEEAPRFSQSGHRFGSRAMAGLVDPELPDRLRDKDGISLADAMRQSGLDPSLVASAARSPSGIRAIVELHIEQGDLLATAGVAVGIVTRITGTTRLDVDVTGSSDHSGGTPMHRRRDALAGAAEMVLAVETIAHRVGGDLVATVGVLDVEPRSISVVPGHVRFGVDVRDIYPAPRRRAVSEIVAAIEDIAARRGLSMSISTIRDDDPVALSEAIQDLSLSVAQRQRVGCLRIPSHTGHDTASLAAITESAMLMVRNESGRSHAAEEYIELDDIVAGTRVLVGVLEHLANP